MRPPPLTGERPFGESSGCGSIFLKHSGTCCSNAIISSSIKRKTASHNVVGERRAVAASIESELKLMVDEITNGIRKLDDDAA